MFKLFEKDKCVTVQLDLTDPTLLVDIVPGTILIDTDDGVRPATNGDTLGEANAGSFYLSADYYSNTMNSSYASSAIPPSASSEQGSGKLAAIPLMESFTAVIPTTLDAGKGDMLVIVNGVLAVANSTNALIIAIVTEDNKGDGIAEVDTKISTFIHRYLDA